MDFAWLFFSIILLLGFMGIYLAEKFGVHKHIILLLTGVIASLFTINTIFFIPPSINLSIASIVFIFIILECSTQIRFLCFDTLWTQGLSFVLVMILMNMSIMALFAAIFFKFNYLATAITFTLITTITSSELVSLIKNKTTSEILRIESVVSTLAVSFIIFFLFDFLIGYSMPGDNLWIAIQRILGGVGLGLTTALVAYFAMQKSKADIMVTSIAFAIGCFLTAQLFYIDAVLALIVYGLIFSNLYLKKKPKAIKVPLWTYEVFEAVLFVLMGLIIFLSKPSLKFIGFSLILFIVYLSIRYVAVSVIFPKLLKKERYFIAFASTKGLNVAAILLLFFSYRFTDSALSQFGISKLIDLSILFVIFTIILSNITIKYHDKFFG